MRTRSIAIPLLLLLALPAVASAELVPDEETSRLLEKRGEGDHIGRPRPLTEVLPRE